MIYIFKVQTAANEWRVFKIEAPTREKACCYARQQMFFETGRWFDIQ